MVPYADDQCPARGPSLTHFASDPDYICAECSQQCLIETVEVGGEPWLDSAKGWRVDLPALRVELAERECITDHDAIIGGRITDQGGAAWVHCPTCNTMIEPRFEQLGPQGNNWGPGRSGSPRQQAMEQQRWGFMAWFYGERGEDTLQP